MYSVFGGSHLDGGMSGIGESVRVSADTAYKACIAAITSALQSELANEGTVALLHAEVADELASARTGISTDQMANFASDCTAGVAAARHAAVIRTQNTSSPLSGTIAGDDLERCADAIEPILRFTAEVYAGTLVGEVQVAFC